MFCNIVHNFNLSLILSDEGEASQQNGAAKETLHMWRADKNQQAGSSSSSSSDLKFRSGNAWLMWDVSFPHDSKVPFSCGTKQAKWSQQFKACHGSGLPGSWLGRTRVALFRVRGWALMPVFGIPHLCLLLNPIIGSCGAILSSEHKVAHSWGTRVKNLGTHPF